MERKELIREFLYDAKYPPLNIEEIMLYLDIPFDDMEELAAILRSLTETGDIVKTNRRKYASPEKLGYQVGKFAANERGFGFLLKEEGDVFIPAAQTGGAMDGDTVMVRIDAKSTADRRREGSVVKVISRANDSVAGTFFKSRNFGFVRADDPKIAFDIFIPKKKFNNAKSGQKVIAQITKWPESGKKPEGKIAEVLGYPNQKGVDILSVIKRHNLETDFDPKAISQCDMINGEISQDDIASREDFRGYDIITIDGEDSRDFDDAVYASKCGELYELGVHIADVSHYVTESSPLDREALKRGTSVYFPDRVVPMLPEKLSNGICSLNPHEDRLTLSVIMKINQKGEVKEHRITEGIICSKERMTYGDVTKILKGDRELKKRYSHIYNELTVMEELAKILRKRRLGAGSVDFDFPETRVVLDESGKAVDVYKYRSDISNKIIEEFMLMANKTVAEEFFWADIPFVYRIHEKPTHEKIAAFNEFGKSLGYRLGVNGEPHPGEFAALLGRVKGTKEEMLISRIMLRTMMKAKYSERCEGHFGLAFRYYCHFTSPIRRYPDLAIHRIIKEHIKYGISEKRYSYLKRFAADAAQKSSEAEIRAMDAERDADDMKKAEYMQSHIGERFSAIISSVTSFGFFAELENGIEGLVRLADLNDDYYVFNSTDLSLTGERTHRSYRIGDRVDIIVASANPAAKQIDFYPTGGQYESDE